jgi:hypothetical protein
MIRFSCVCGATLKATDAAAGRAAHCPTCGMAIEVPAAAAGQAPAEADAPTPTLPRPAVSLSRLAKAELLRRAQGRCGRCRTQVNLATARFHRAPSNGSPGSPGSTANGDWTVLCAACLDRTVEAPAPSP